MKDGTIQDSQITASSVMTSNDPQVKSKGKNNARLDRPSDVDTFGGWSPKPVDSNKWIGVEFATYTHVSGIILQGREDGSPHWVTKYKVAYSGDGATWRYIQDEGRVNNLVSYVRETFIWD